MLEIGPNNYYNFCADSKTSHVVASDHLGGFDSDLRCLVLDRLSHMVQGSSISIESEYIVNQKIKDNYPNFKFVFGIELHNRILDHFQRYTIHPELTFANFLCSFNGTPHVSRKLLVAILHKFGWFDPSYSSKNFKFSQDILSGHIRDYVGENERYYNKFFLSNNKEFYDTVYSFGHNRFDHAKNIHTLEGKLTGSFVHLVSDTMATIYYPFFGEKFLYSVVTRGLFVTYGQPGWHKMLEQCYGFKKYNKIFNYEFDSITNPVERLVELITMLGKFSNLSTSDWQDLYLLESDTIEFNYNHYFSRDYLIDLKKC